LLLHTARLDLVPLTPACAAAAPEDREVIAREIGAAVPDNWPVEHYDQEMLDFTREELSKDSDAWPIRYVVLREPQRTVAGMVGCMTPDDDGRVMIGYSILPQFQRRGIASEALAAVIEFAFRDARVGVIAGDTYPDLIASIRTMEHCGLRFAGDGKGEGVIRYELRRAQRQF
jgi:RimJ/RimL family protein N-acetyltransferase